MNIYSQLLIALKTVCENHELVNTVTKGDTSLIDIEKANIYPLVHISVETGNFTNGQTIVFNVSLECLQQRDLSKEIVDDKFWRQDNEVDNHNETLAILNDIWLKLFRDWAEEYITASENPSFEKIDFEKGNILDGWALDFELELPNTTINLCT